MEAFEELISAEDGGTRSIKGLVMLGTDAMANW